MPDAQYIYTMQQLAETLIREQGITEGTWRIAATFANAPVISRSMISRRRRAFLPSWRRSNLSLAMRVLLAAWMRRRWRGKRSGRYERTREEAQSQTP